MVSFKKEDALRQAERKALDVVNDLGIVVPVANRIPAITNAE